MSKLPMPTRRSGQLLVSSTCFVAYVARESYSLVIVCSGDVVAVNCFSLKKSLVLLSFRRVSVCDGKGLCPVGDR